MNSDNINKFDRCTIFESFYQFAEALPTDADRGQFYSGIIKYSLYGIEPEFQNAIVKACFVLIKPNIDSSNIKRISGKQAKSKQKASKTTNDIDIDIDIDIEKDINPVSAIFSFNDFWAMYDLKADRDKCEKVYKKLSHKDQQAILDRLPDYIDATPNVKFRKNPLTWLHGKCWNDDEIQTKPAKKALPL
jgi:hypothetical protein